MAELTMEIMDVESVLENEIAKGLKQKDVAETYAMALVVRHYKVDFARMNKAILAKWPRGLERVKNMAWKIMEERRKEARSTAAKRN